MPHSSEFIEIVEKNKKFVNEISAEEALEKSDSVIVDTREESERARGYIKGSIHIGKGVLERDIVKTIPDKSKSIVLYCGGGLRSVLAAKSLNDMDYENVYSLIGGWKEWNEKALPVEIC